MNIITQITKALMFAAIAAAFVMVALLVNDTRTVVKQVPTVVQNELQQTRILVDQQMTGLRADTMGKITEVQKNLNHEVNGLAVLADSRIGKIQIKTFDAVDNLSKNLDGQLTVTNKSVSALTTAYAKIPENIGSRIDYYTDCDKNGLCWQGQFTDSLLAARKSSRDTSVAMDSISKTVPLMAKDWTTVSDSLSVSIPKITNNAADITKNIEYITHPKWYWRVLGAAGQGSTIYFNVRPLTAIPTK